MDSSVKNCHRNFSVVELVLLVCDLASLLKRPPLKGPTMISIAYASSMIANRIFNPIAIGSLPQRHEQTGSQPLILMFWRFNMVKFSNLV